MITTLEKFSNFSNISDDDKIIGLFSIYKIINEPYQRIKIKDMQISFKTVKDIFDDIIETKIDHEYSIFSLDKEITYDNKTKGGRISINISTMYNVYTNKSINKAQTLFPLSINISLMHRFYFVLSSLFLLKNYYKNEINAQELSLKFINSIEGIILQKNIKNIKIIISIDEDFTLTELGFICGFIKKILYMDSAVTFKYNYYKDIGKSYIIK